MSDYEKKRDKRHRMKDGPVTKCKIERFAQLNCVSVEEARSFIGQFGTDPTPARKVPK